jgi:hypothetical protein
MLSKSAVIAVLTLSTGLLLATAAQAKTFKGTFSSKCTDVSINGLLSFDGISTSSEALVTCSLNSIFPTKPSLGGASDLQGVTEFSIGSTSCTFTGVFGEAESGVTTSAVGALYAQDGVLLTPAYHSDRFACRQKDRTRGGRRRMRRSARRA